MEHLPFASAMPTVRIAAVADIHVGKNSQGTFAPLVTQAAERADVLLLCGDLTDYGLPEEARILVKEIGAHRIPIIAVLGNHDYESGHVDEVREILQEAGIVMLDGESHEVSGVGFAGIKGFCGGFGRGVLGSWGEHAVKCFVKEAVDETLKLETALARLRTPQKIGLLHYSPIRETVEGEPIEIFPWLGCSRHEEPLTRYNVSAVFHGHAHRGSPEGRMSNGTPVFNVALPLLKARYPERPPFVIIEVNPDQAGENGSKGSGGYDGMERRKPRIETVAGGH